MQFPIRSFNTINNNGNPAGDRVEGTGLEIHLTKLEEAILWLNKRTMDREVEGTHQI